MNRKIICGLVMFLLYIGILGNVVASDHFVYYQENNGKYEYNKIITSNADVKENMGVNNEIALSAEIQKVDESEVDGYNAVCIKITATTSVEWSRQKSTYYDGSGNEYDIWTSFGIHKQLIEAENIDNNAEDLHIDFQESFNSGKYTVVEKEGDDPDDIQDDLGELAADQIKGAVDTWPSVWSVASFWEDVLEPKPVKDQSGAQGYGTARTTFKAEDRSIECEGEKTTILGSTFLSWRIPEDDTETHKLKISAINRVGHWLDWSISGIPDHDYTNSAKSSITITIKNSEIQSVINRPDSTDYTSYKSYQSVQTEIGAVLPKYRYDRPDIKKFYVDWGDDGGWGDPVDIPSDYEPYSRVQNPDGSGYRYVNNTFPVTHQYTGLDEGENDFTIKVKAVCHDKYGNWSYSGGVKEITIDYIDDDDGGGGGGGCPYISPWNGTKYKQENNLLVQSEFQSGEVTDYYKLDTNLQQKNGNNSMKIEEFENSEDFIDQMKLYTLDHKKGYKVGVTPEGEYVTYKDSDAPIEAYNSTGDDVLNMVKEKNDNKRLEMDEGSEVILDYGNRSMSRWQFNKLILRSSGFESFTDESEFNTMFTNPGGPIKTSLYVSIKADGSEWKNVTVTHPRNNPHDSVIPLEDQLTDVLVEGHDLSDFKVKIESTKNHHIDYVGLDNSAPTPVHVQEADLLETIKTDSDGNKKYLNRSLTEDDNAVMHLTPSESCTVNFDVPYQIPGFEERDFVVMTKGFYTKYE